MNGLNELYPPSAEDVPKTPKFIRLGFHDCLKYADGTGGCDGCLNWHNMGHRFPPTAEQRENTFQFDVVDKSDNNGLRLTVEVLEQIYIDKDFPEKMGPSMEVSLRDSGKSRADLWAFAAIVAVEYGIETNNMVCNGTFKNNPSAQCNQELGEPNCEVKMPRRIKFKTGRRDCTEFGDKGYIATKEESHPSLVGNGRMTADFFQKDFGLNGQEIVALFGAHTMGEFHPEIGLFKYTWTTAATESFNNHYFKNIVREDRYAFTDMTGKCYRSGLQDNVKPKTRWLARVRWETKNGGPVHWIHENYRCPNCVTDKREMDLYKDTCCKNIAPGYQCSLDSKEGGMENDPDVNDGCEMWNFNFGIDEMALSAEIGLYFDFEVTEDGIPYGCPGMNRFNSTWWTDPNKKRKHEFYKIQALVQLIICDDLDARFKGTTYLKEGTNPDDPKNWHEGDPDCPMNTMKVPAGKGKQIYKYFEDYAKNQNLWINDFIAVYEKMLQNGFKNSELIDGPNQYDGVFCERRGPGKRHFCEHIV